LIELGLQPVNHKKVGRHYRFKESEVVSIYEKPLYRTMCSLVV
jgi:hypothetical protein